MNPLEVLFYVYMGTMFTVAVLLIYYNAAGIINDKKKEKLFREIMENHEASKER